MKYMNAEIRDMVPCDPDSDVPHAWIDIEVQVLLDGAARVTALRMPRLFDPVYKYDSTYQIKMLHAENEDAIRLMNAPVVILRRPRRIPIRTGCAKPPPWIVPRVGAGPGVFFAERVTIRCDQKR